MNKNQNPLASTGRVASGLFAALRRWGAAALLVGLLGAAPAAMASGAAPTFVTVPGDQSTPEDNPLVGLGVVVSDAEGDSLTLSAVSGSQLLIPNANLSVVPASGGPGTYSRTLSITPVANRHGGPVLITLTLFDGTSTVQTSFTVTITEVNDAPIVVADALSAIAEDSGDRAIGTSSLLANDSAGPLEPLQNLTVTAVGAPVGGTVSLAGTTITFSPAANFNGPASFTYTATDDGTTNGAADPLSATATVSFTVTEVNDAPDAIDDTLSAIDEDSGNRTIAFTALLGNDSTGPANESGQTLSVTAVGSAVGGTVSIVGTDVVFAPALNFNGAASFSYTATDNGTTNGAADPLGDSATVSFTINAVNDAPVAVDDTATVAEDSGANTIAVLGNDTDVENDTLAITAVTQGANGTVVNNGTDVSYTPNADFFGADSFTYDISDGNGGTDTATVNVTVTEVNDAPTATDDTLASIAEDSGNRTIAFTALTGNDSAGPVNEAGQALTITSVGNAVGGTVSIVGTDVVFAPTLHFNGAASFDYTLSDNGTTNGAPAPLTDVGAVTFTITEVNDAPDAVNDTLTAVDEDSATRVIPAADLLANDSTGPANESGQALAVTAVGTPVGGTVVLNGTDVEFTPALNFNGTASFSYTATDDGTTNGAADPLGDTATVTFTVTAVNDDPVAGDDVATTPEDTGVLVSVLSNDTDVDGDTLTVTVVSDPANGTATTNGTTVTYTPDANFNGADSFTYDISDGNGGTDTATVNVTVTEVNDAPDAVNDTLTAVDEDSATRVIPAADLLANDSTGPANESGQTLVVTAVGTPVGGTVVLNGTDVEFTPALNFNGTASFSYTATDDGTTNGAADPLSDTATVTFTVTAVNDDPVAGDDVATTPEDTGVLVSVLSNDTDVDGDTLTVTVVSDPANGTATTNGTTVTYTPDANFNGADSFTYDISDGNGGTDTATVNVTVTEVNDAPTAVDDALGAIDEDSGNRTIAFTALLGNDSTGPANESGQTLSVTAVGSAVGGTVSIVGTDVVFAPALNFNGAASFSYTATDNGTTNGAADPLGDSATVSFTINAVNDAPVAVDDTATVAEDSGANTIAVLANDTDVENDTLTITAVTQGANGTVVNNGTDVSYTPNADFFGADSFTYDISDGNGGTDTATVNVTVTEVNDAPTATDDTLASIAEDSGNRTIAFTALTGNDSAGPVNEAGQALTITSVGNAVGGTVSIVGTDVVFAPTLHFNGAASFDYTLSDNGTTNGAPAPLTDVGAVTFTITEVNDAPDAVNDTLTAVDEDSATRVIPAADLLANDSTGPANESGQALAVTAVGTPVGGTVVLNGTDVEFTPALNFNGTASFSYTATDDGTTNGAADPLSDTATVTFTVTAVNDDPVAVDDNLTTDEDTAGTLNVVANDTDIDLDTLSVSAVTQGTNGTVTFAGGSVTYTPNANFNGADTFDYTVSDGNGGTDSGTVTVTINAVNDAPDAVDDAATTAEDTPVLVDVLDNDTDVENDTLTVTGTTHGANGTVTTDGTTATYTPNLNFNGSDSFTYTISDGNGGSDTATVNVTVTPVNDDPVFVVTPADITAVLEDSTTGPLTVTLNDVDGDPITLSASSGNQALVPNASIGLGGTGYNRTVTFTIAPDKNSDTSIDDFVEISLVAFDGNGGNSNTSFTINFVTPVNDPPTFALPAPTVTVAEDAGAQTATGFATNRLVGPTTATDETATQTLTAFVITPVSSSPTLTFTSGPSIDPATGTLTYTAAADAFGTASFTAVLVDSGPHGTPNGDNGRSTAIAFTIVVTNINDAPVAVDDTLTTAEDTAGTVNVVANDTDVDLDTLSVSAVTQGTNGAVTFTGGSVTYTPNANFNGTDSFDYTVSDGNGGTDTGTVSVTVTAVNDAPVAVDDTLTTAEDTAGTVNVVANDTDVENDTRTVSAVTQGANGAVTFTGGSVTYTPNANFNGTDSFDYTVSDGNGGTDTGTVSVTVTAVNDAPVAVDDTLTTAEDTAGTVNVVANDTDVDLDTLTVSAVTQGANGAVTFTGGSVTYTPNANFNGTDSFDYTGSDGNGGTDTGTVSVTVTAVNDPPVAVDDTLTTAEDTAGTVNVVANDTDVENDTLVVTAAGPAGNGTVTFTGGSVTYTPNANFNGTDSFNYTVSDGNGGTDTGAVNVTVTAVNDAPVADNDAYTTDEDNTLTVAAPGVLDGDTDVENSTLTATLVGNVTSGTLTLNTDGSFTYTPNANFFGTDTFTYRANDGSADSNLATVTITVNAVNDAPVADNDAYTTDEDNTLTVAAPGVLDGDTDVENSTLTATLVGNVTSGTLTLNTDGSFTYTPNANFFGTDTFTYRANDGSANSNLATVTITVNAVNDAPVADNDAYTTDEDNTLTVAAPGVLDGDTDVENSTLTATLVGNVTSGTLTLNTDGSFTYTPNANFFGTDTFTYRANDGSADSNLATVTITVTSVNDPPVAVDDTLTTAEDTAGTVNVVANDTDVENDTRTVSAVTQGANGAVTFTGGSVTYTPNANFNGTDSFDYTVSDGNGGTDTGTVSVTVTAVNDPPVAVDDTLTTAEDTAGTVSVVANDTDVENDTLSVTAVTQGANGTVTFAGGSVTYTPNPNTFGGDAFDYTVSDGNGGTDTGTVFVTVTPVNDAPVAVDDTLTTAEDTPGTLFNVVGNDTDADFDTLTVTAVTQGTFGTVTFGSFDVTYTPNANFNGTDSFDYTVSDGNGGTDTGTVNVTVTAVNDAPVLTPTTFAVAENTANGTLIGAMIAIDPEVPGMFAPAATNGIPGGAQTLTYSIAGGNTGGAFAIDPGTGDITVANSAALDFETNPTFALTIRATDNGIPPLFGEAVATINLTDVNETPTATPQSLNTLEDAPLSITLAGTDPEGAALAFTITTQPTSGTLSGTAPNLTYTPNADFNGTDSFAFTVSDPAPLTSAPATVAITVLSVNDRPSFSNLGARAHAAGSSGMQSVPGWAFNVILGPANESSQAVQAYTAVEFSDPSNVLGAVAVANDGTLQYTLTGSSGVAEVDVALRDNGGTANGGIDTSLTARLLIGVGIEADLSITKTNGVTVVEEQQAVVYTIVASNPGTAGVTGARVVDWMPPDLAGATWTCTPAGGASCPASGTGDINVMVNLPVGGSATFTVTGTAQGALDDVLENMVFIVPPPAVFDPNLANNEATDSDLAALMIDGFEDP